jgi:hypothetical protein
MYGPAVLMSEVWIGYTAKNHISATMIFSNSILPSM